FAVSALILKFTGQPEGDLSAATAQMEEQKGRKSSVAGSLTAEDSEAQKALEEESTDADSSIDYANVDKIVFACDAGMGSSAMGAGMLKNKFKKAGLDRSEERCVGKQRKGDEDISITQKKMTESEQEKVPEVNHISVDNFLNSPKYDELLERLKDSSDVQTDKPAEDSPSPDSSIDYANVDKIVFACDAGMGSSAMGAGMLKNKFKKAGLDIDVTNSAINQLT